MSNTNHTFRYTKIFLLPCFATCYITISQKRELNISGNRQWNLLNINICTLYMYIFFTYQAFWNLHIKGCKCILLLYCTMILIALLCNLFNGCNIRRECISPYFRAVIQIWTENIIFLDWRYRKIFFANNSQCSYLPVMYWIWTMPVVLAIAASGPFY